MNKIKIRTTGLLGVGFALAMAGLALAGTPYRAGTYRSGAQTGTLKPGLRLEVTAGKFAVNRISYPETCTGGGSVIRDEFNFVAGQGASLTGTIDKHGRFSARFSSIAGTVKVAGRLQGSSATTATSETNTFTPAGSTARYTCTASHTFRAMH